MYYDKVYVSNNSRLGTFQQCNEKSCTTGMFQDWEMLSIVKTQGMTQHWYKIRNCSAM